MITGINKDILDRIRGIDWLRNVGLCSNDERFLTISSWNEVILYASSEKWENVALDARKPITEYLSANFNIEYNKWNGFIRETKLFIDGEILEGFIYALDKRGFEYNDNILKRWKWNLMTAIMEDTYSSYVLPVTFCSELLELYGAGYFPCGWHGDRWPDGKLVVF